jgi:glycerophosphoryl diester phosphodiesterase
VVHDIKKSGILINVYTVNKEDEMKKLIELGIDGIITNYPNILKKLFG